MLRRVSDRDGDEIEIEALPERGIVWINFPTEDGDDGPGRALTIDQTADLIDALTNAAKEIGR
tara:strand:+ start:1150 stop:1338 length:189 start_codon:yes stop_codon:yes gene_type:complete